MTTSYLPSGGAWSGLLGRWAPAAVLAASVAVLGTALASQYIGGLAPCRLCHYQRWAYIAAIVLSVPALLPAIGARGRRALVALCGVAFVAGGAVALYHVGVENGWVAGPAACTGAPDLDAARSPEELRRLLMAQPVVRCDEVAWSLFGISLAGYNVIASAVLAAFAFVAAARRPGTAR